MLPVHLYRTLLWCYPAPFRREYGADMIDAFAEQVREARRHEDRRAEVSAWLGALADLFLIAPQEHAHVIRQDLRYAIRTLAANPGFTAVAILSLALGIGANTAIFSLLNDVRMSSLPVRNPQELVMLSDPNAGGVFVGAQTDQDRSLLTYTEFEQLRDRGGAFSGLFASESNLDRLEARVNGGSPEQINGRMVSAEYFQVLGLPMLVGRGFDAEDNKIGAAPHAVISYDYWQRRFGKRADVLGTTIALRGGVFSVIGVAPSSFFGETVGQRPDVWLPLSMQAQVLPGRDWLHDKPGDIDKAMWLHVFGRMKPGLSIEQAQADANLIFKQGLAAYYGGAADLAPKMRSDFMNQRLKVRPAMTGASQLRGQFSEPLLMLLIAAGLVLLIACANLGNLMLARTTARHREMSVRLALGAGRGRLIRQLMRESLFLALLGGIAGIAAALIVRAGLLRLVPDDAVLPTNVDARVVGFAFGLTLLAGFLLGILPALRTTSADPASGLQERGRGLAGSTAFQRIGKLVVIGQLALSVPLLVGAGLLLQTLYNLQTVDLGYAKQRLLIVTVDTQSAGYEEPRRFQLFEQLLANIRAVPGVRGATYSAHGLFSGGDSGDEVIVEGYTRKGDNDGGSAYDHVGSNYFSTLGIPILLGREIGDRDQVSGSRVSVINEAFAKLYFAGRNPLGMHVTQVYGNQRNTFEIVGVARDIRSRSLRGMIRPRFYVPMGQPINLPGFVAFEIRTAAEPKSVIEGVRRAVAARDPNLPIVQARELTGLVDDAMVQDRLLARLSVAFGLLALLLASIGLYGVLSYGVARRTNEIGIRKALGAQHGAVIGMILRETTVLLAIGLITGALLSVAGASIVRSRLYGIAATDPLTYVLAVAVLAAVALVAAWLPAHRAARVDPLVALRYE